jgi:predicted nuclease of predicted toxin-antitoxin system
MRILLDECLPRKLKYDIPDHDVSTVIEMGWASIRNGQLLSRAQATYDVLLTVDRNMEHQQDIAIYDLAVVLIARSNKRQTLGALVPALLAILDVVQPGQVYHVTAQE